MKIRRKDVHKLRKGARRGIRPYEVRGSEGRMAKNMACSFLMENSDMIFNLTLTLKLYKIKLVIITVSKNNWEY